MSWPRRESFWARLGWRFLPVVAVLLYPWPGVGERFAAGVAGLCNGVASLDWIGGARIQFLARRPPSDPWLIELLVENVFTGQRFGIPVDTRTVAYLRIATFAALACVWPVSATRRGLRALAFGIAVFVILLGLTLAIPLAQVLGMIKALSLGVVEQSLLSVGILTLVTYPSMAFALPGLIWWGVLRLADPNWSAGASCATAQLPPPSPLAVAATKQSSHP